MRSVRFIKRIVIMLVSAAVLLCVCPAVSAQEDVHHVVTVYNEQNGLPTGEANVVEQTSDGYIWIGSYGGLIRYDGTTFRNYSLEGAIGSSSVRALYEDTKGRLWIGTNDAGVFLFQDNAFSKISCAEENSFLCIRDFAESPDGRIYTSSNSGIGYIDGEELVPFMAEGVYGETFYSAAVDSKGRIWGATTSGMCTMLDSEGAVLKQFGYSDLDLGSDIYCVENNAAGDIFIGTLENVAAKLSFPSDNTEPSSFIITRYDTGNVTTHNHINVTEDGDVLVSGLSGYGILSADGSFKQFGENEHAVSLNCSIKDYEGNYWLASSSYGMIKYSVGCFNNSNDISGLGDTTVNAVTLSGGCYYIGLDTGLLVFDESWQPVDNKLTQLLSGVRVRCVISDRNGRVWVAVYSDDCIICYDPRQDSLFTFNSNEGFISNRGRVLLELSNGDIAAGTQNGLAIIRGDKLIQTYTSEDGLETVSILCLAEGKDGIIYAGSDGGGIYEIADGKVTNHGFDSGLGEGVVLRMAENSDGAGYFVSAGSSLYYWADNTFRKLDNFEKGAGSIFDLYDRNGKLWMLQNNGVISVDKASLLSGGKTDTVEYSFEHGLTGSLNANTWNHLSEDGTLYMATRQGISTFMFRGVDNCLPMGIFNSVTVDGEVYEHPSAITLPSGARRMNIDFAALSYTDTTSLSIAYKLVGFDSEETILSDSKNLNVSYTNLPGGEYKFNVRIFDPENAADSSLVTLRIVKAKTIFEEIWFWLLLIAAVAAVSCGAALLFSRNKINNMRRRQNEYKEIVDQSLRTFAKTIDAKDNYTKGHSVRVAQYSREIARRMKLSEDEQERIYYVALLHDIGKIGIPDSILNKPDKLTEEERAVIQTHSSIGGDILKNFTALDGISEGAKYHHERYDGNGYCEKLKGEDIPIVARIIGVADTYDAMSSDRCYRKALSTETILKELENGKGTQFDPEIVPYMLQMIEDGFAPLDTER